MTAGTTGAPATSPGELVVLEDTGAIGDAAADRIVRWLGDGVADRDEAHIALTGGSSTVPLYRELQEPDRRTALPWGRVHLWWGDERFVPIDHPDSNAGTAWRMLLAVDEQTEWRSLLPVAADHVHPIPVEEAIGRGLDPAWAAERYAEALAGSVTRRSAGVPALDVILLGVGPDGHILSVFPGSPAFAPDAPLVLAIPAPRHVGPHLDRVTISPRLLDAADHVLVMASGEGKAGIVREVLRGEADPARLPARLAVRPNATWLLDRAAAAELG